MATLANQSQANLQSFGQNGFTVVTDTTDTTGDFSAITIVADADFSSITATNTVADSLSGVSIPAGVTIFGKITGFTLTSGSVIAYYAV